jgi:phage head maturation protease
MKPELQKKTFEITDLKVAEEGGKVIVSGYANTKNKPDRYGDIPTVFPQLRSFVYDLSDFQKNPVMLIDHKNSVDHIAGSYVEVKEDEIGLFVKGVFSNSDLPLIKHARTVYAEGHAKAFSIAGYWYFEDKDHPDHLTLAEICEISLVGVGADPNALGTATMEKRLAEEQAAKHAKEGEDIKAMAETVSSTTTLANDILKTL